MSKYDDLVKKLKEIFQIDKPELDFGVYRILRSRIVEINKYLELDLDAKIKEAFEISASSNIELLKKELVDKEQQYLKDGVDPGNVPRIKELREVIQEGASVSEYENQVYSHLLIFFSRYYQNGDFISQRRYKGDTYSIPYSGEEVVLHWVNKDQYYTKSGENFSNYAFRLEDGRSVAFKLVIADTSKDNRKDEEKERRFVLVDRFTKTVIDENGEGCEVDILPVEESEDGLSLTISFEYKVMPKGSKQEDLVSDAISKISSDSIVLEKWQQLLLKDPTEKNTQRTLLGKCISSYVGKNTADYFIHKNLKRFLNGELDFYIKNEIINLDDIQNANSLNNFQKNLRLVQVFRSIAGDLIQFLSQLEEFQKKLWLKKKFVVSSDYCITLSLVPKSLYGKIVENKKQWNQWDSLGFIGDEKSDLLSKGEVGTEEYLLSHPHLIVDTSIFDNHFKYLLLATIDNLDEKINGVMINSDNYQALRFLKNKYSGAVDLIHIDPPYNTDTSGFAYKNNFRHSSWLSLMSSRIDASIPLLKGDGQYVCHIDENEYEKLHLLFDGTTLNNSGTVIWDKRNPMNGGSGVALQHEYIIWRNAGARPLILPNDSVIEMLNKAKELIKSTGSVNESVRKQYSSWIGANKKLSGGEQAYRYIDDAGNVYRSVSLRAPEPRKDKKFHQPLIHPTTKKPCAVPPNGFSRTPETLAEMVSRGEILFGADETTQPNQKRLLTEDSSRQLSSVIQDAKKGKTDTTAMNLNFPYCHPVSLYELLIQVATKKQDLILDFFAGSGTTGHSVIQSNRKDGGSRKFLLVEQGEYFDTVTLPRIKKAIFSSAWSDGKPTLDDGLTQIIKVIKLEGYEDSLNNIELNRTQEQINLLDQMPPATKENYLLNYIVNLESKNSLLSVEDFKNPFNYQLKIAADSAGSQETRAIDLVESFNYLLGLAVKQIDPQLDRGFLIVTGTLPNGESAIVIWRDQNKVNYEELNSICNKLAINPSDNEFDIVYINGDHNIPTAFTSLEVDGGITKSIKIRQIEPEFFSAMFAPEIN